MTTHAYPEAAVLLRVPERWLRRNISRLPHSKKGRVVTFTDADLAAIDAMHRVEPQVAVVAMGTPSELRPLPLRRSTGSGVRSA